MNVLNKINSLTFQENNANPVRKGRIDFIGDVFPINFTKMYIHSFLKCHVVSFIFSFFANDNIKRFCINN